MKNQIGFFKLDEPLWRAWFSTGQGNQVSDENVQMLFIFLVFVIHKVIYAQSNDLSESSVSLVPNGLVFAVF